MHTFTDCRTYLHCAWKYLMRFWSRSTPFLILISFTLRRYCETEFHNVSKPSTTSLDLTQSGNPGLSSTTFLTHLTHLQLEEPPLLLHLLCYLRPADLSADHAVLPRVLLLLLLDLSAGTGSDIVGGGSKGISNHRHTHTKQEIYRVERGRAFHATGHSFLA